MTPQDLQDLREGWSFEAKLARGRDGKGEVPRSLWETYSAMANARGGVIALGVEERRDGTLRFRGIPETDRVLGDFWNTITNPAKVSANILSESSIERIPGEDGDVILIHVPKAARADRPIYLNGAIIEGVYIRVHEGDRKVLPERAQRMLADRYSDIDSKPIELFTLNDFHIPTVRRYREFFRAKRPAHQFLQESDTDFLVAIRAALLDREGGNVVRPNLGGLCMFGKTNSIMEHLPFWRLSYKEVPDEPDPMLRWTDRIWMDGTWEANLFEFYLLVINRLHLDLKIPFKLEDGQFRVDNTPVHDAVREALVNTLVHTDFRGTTGVRVIKKQSRFEFINPGLLLIDADQLWKGGVSEPRNPIAHHLFSIIRLGEREGSGGPAMRHVWSEQHWRAPRVWEDVEHFDTHLELPKISLLPDWAVQRLVHRFGRYFEHQDELGRLILIVTEVEGSVDHTMLSEWTEAHSRDVTVKLQELMRREMLVGSKNQRPKTYAPNYTSSEELELLELNTPSSGSKPASSDAKPATSGAKPVTSSANTGTSGANTGSSGANTGSSGVSDTSSGAKPATSGASDTSSGASDTSSGASDTSSRLISSVRKSRRMRPEIVDAAILVLCTRYFLSVEEISERLQRSVVSVRARYVPRLLESGKLEMKYPDTPTHAHQAYRATNIDTDKNE